MRTERGHRAETEQAKIESDKLALSGTAAGTVTSAPQTERRGVADCQVSALNIHFCQLSFEFNAKMRDMNENRANAASRASNSSSITQT